MIKCRPGVPSVSSKHFPLCGRTQVRHKTQKFILSPSFYPQNNQKPPQQLPRAKSGHKYLASGNASASASRRPIIQHNVTKASNQNAAAGILSDSDKYGANLSRHEALDVSLTKLDNVVEEAVSDAAKTTLGINTSDAVRQFCGSDTHPDFFPYIRGYLERHYIRSDPLKYIWSAIRDVLPEDPLNKSVRTPVRTLSRQRFRYSKMPSVGTDQVRNRMSLAWHLLMGNPNLYPANLLSDGTNVRFMPGRKEKWPYRLWAGGSITVHSPRFHEIDSPQIWHMAEVPETLRIEGSRDPAKAFVTIHKIWNKIQGRWPLRMYNKDNILKAFRQYSVGGTALTSPVLTETYTLCFLQDPPNLSSHATRVIKPPYQPKFQHTLTPSRHLLFAWSALTMNAHLIHLDPEFTKRVYGAPNLLVHGPLTLFLMLECFERTMNRYAMDRQLPLFEIRSVEYKNLTPLYVDEPMTLCMKPTKFQTPGTLADSWDVWIEKKVGEGLTSMAFKGTIKMNVGDEALDRTAGGSMSDYVNDGGEEGEFSSPFFS